MVTRALLALAGLALVATSGAATAPVKHNDSPTSSPAAHTTKAPPRLLPPWHLDSKGDWTLQLGGMQRLRYEHRGNFDMNHRSDDSDRFMPVRTQVNAALINRGVTRAFLEILDARVTGQRIDYQQEAYAHVNQAWVDLRQPGPNPWALRLGRQELTLGESVLVDTSQTWSNLPSIFQGALLTRSTAVWNLNAFLMQPMSYRKAYEGRITSDEKHKVDGQWF